MNGPIHIVFSGEALPALALMAAAYMKSFAPSYHVEAVVAKTVTTTPEFLPQLLQEDLISLEHVHIVQQIMPIKGSAAPATVLISAKIQSTKIELRLILNEYTKCIQHNSSSLSIEEWRAVRDEIKNEVFKIFRDRIAEAVKSY